MVNSYWFSICRMIGVEGFVKMKGCSLKSSMFIQFFAYVELKLGVITSLVFLQLQHLHASLDFSFKSVATKTPHLSISSSNSSFLVLLKVIERWLRLVCMTFFCFYSMLVN